LEKTKDNAKQNTTELHVSSRTVSISNLMDLVAKNYPPGSPPQVVFFGEEDVLSTEAFLGKTPIWDKLSTMFKIALKQLRIHAAYVQLFNKKSKT
jgi:hypothetical protein